MQARGSARGKGQEFGASGKMSADDVEKMDRMQAWQETSSLEIVIFEKLKNKTFMHNSIRNICGEMGNETNLHTPLYLS